MSWLDSVVDFGKGVFNFVTGDSAGGALARSALLGYGVRQLTNSINRENEPQKDSNKQIDPGVRLDVNPDTEKKVPVVYGQAFLTGSIVDARLSNGNLTMWYVIVLSELTGTKISNSLPSSFVFESIYYNDEQLVFKSDGITVDNAVDRTGQVNGNYEDLIKVYCFNGNSDSPVVPTGYSNGSLYSAYTIMPDWDSDFDMTNLVFAIVRIDYNKEKSVTGLGNMIFKIRNTMTLPGDCLYDLMTSTRYGASIDPSEISV